MKTWNCRLQIADQNKVLVRFVILFFAVFIFQFFILNFQPLLPAQAPSAPDQPEPPVRLKKKVKPQPEMLPMPAPESKEEPKPKKTESPKSQEPTGDAERNIQDAQEKIREIHNRISKNLSQAEERLHKNDSGEVTQQTQGEIVRDLGVLIEQTRRQQQSRSSSSSSNQRNQQTRRNHPQRNQASGNPEQEQPENASTGSPQGGKKGQEGMSKIADLYKDVWGHLPQTLRQEMDQYSREQFMAKYADLLKQYYATIAEKGRRKAEP
ncbi:MAG TPA: hypothetical protein VKU02_21760 [Gemmataceae bacterium]|nr:hypothetical protein [Gemmataceae bacterium]